MCSLPTLQAKASTILRQQFSTLKMFQTERNKKALARAHVVLTPGGGGIQNMQDEYKEHLHLLTWIAALVLLVACANIANLLLVRGMSRRAEISIRTALGAQRSRIMRQVLTESVLLAGLGGLLGLGVSFLGAACCSRSHFPVSVAFPLTPRRRLAVIAFAFGLSLVTGILFGVAPAWLAARTQPAEALRSTPRTTAHGASWLQRALVVLQAALSLVLLVAAGLFTQSLNKLQGINMKLDAANRYIIHVNPQAAGYATTQVEALYRTIEDRFHALPGVVKVGLATYTPMEDNNWRPASRFRVSPIRRSRLLGQGHGGVLRFGWNTRGDGPRIFDSGHDERSARGSGESGVCEAVLRQAQSHRPSLRLPGPGKMEPMRSSV